MISSNFTIYTQKQLQKRVCKLKRPLISFTNIRICIFLNEKSKKEYQMYYSNDFSLLNEMTQWDF